MLETNEFVGRAVRPRRKAKVFIAVLKGHT